MGEKHRWITTHFSVLLFYSLNDCTGLKLKNAFIVESLCSYLQLAMKSQILYIYYIFHPITNLSYDNA